MYNLTHAFFEHTCETMTKRDKIQFQKAFFAEAGENLASVKKMMDTLPDVGFYVKDAEGRIVTFNKRNCEIANLSDEYAAVGRRSDELFPSAKAKTYVANDRHVLKTGKPLRITHTHPADGSMRMSHKSVFPVRSADGRRIIGTMCLYRQDRKPETSLEWHDHIKSITAYINQHPTEDLSLRRLATLGQTTPSKLARAFGKILNTTPAKYVTTVRLNLARNLLEETDQTLTDIAQAAGFYDFSHFFHTFRRARGLTPAQYRARHRSV